MLGSLGLTTLTNICVFLTLPTSLAPLHLMLADTPWPHGSDAILANVGPLSEGFERSVTSPSNLVGYVRWTHSLSISSLPDNHSNSFQVAIRVARDSLGIAGYKLI